VKHGQFEDSRFMVSKVQFILVYRVYNFLTLNYFEGLFVFLKMCHLLSSYLSICVFMSFQGYFVSTFLEYVCL
jgi:hypothetical protein